MKKLVLRIVLLAFFSISHFTAQSQEKVKQNSTYYLQAFYDQLFLGHPIIKQANLLSDFGKQEIRLARGNFDPKLYSNYDEKRFKEVRYYQTWESELKIPTYLGIDFKVGYERNSGEFLDPERTVPATGLAYAGIIVPVGQGLLFDGRRAALQEAQYARSMLEAERIKVINKAILQATKDYWSWYLAHHQLLINQKGFDLAKVRYEGIVERIAQGDAAAIDSIEAKITVQQREISLQESKVILNNAKLILSNHLWDADSNPILLLPEVIPTQNLNELGGIATLDELLAFAKENHPELLKYDFKTKQLEVSRKLSIEMMKPVINLNYNLLGQSPLFEDSNKGAFFKNNYKYGVAFYFPLLLRKERAKFQQTNIKLQQNILERTQVSREILNDVNTLYNDLKNIENLLKLQENMVNNYQILLNGEQEKFFNGESSLFLVNSRESSLLSSELKLIELQFKYAKTKAELLWAAGRSI
ncbi:MAG: TolC family protein [Cytophagales bacterium]|nr:MAG: TolC family protein [Cytophagales bacterium]